MQCKIVCKRYFVIALALMVAFVFNGFCNAQTRLAVVRNGNQRINYDNFRMPGEVPSASRIRPGYNPVYSRMNRPGYNPGPSQMNRPGYNPGYSPPYFSTPGFGGNNPNSSTRSPSFLNSTQARSLILRNNPNSSTRSPSWIPKGRAALSTTVRPRW